MSHPVRVKICGVRTPEEALFAAECGADAVGLNFHPPSPRSITPSAAQEILHHLPPFVTAVGVFVSRRVADIPTLAGLRVIQMHGDIEVAQAWSFAYVPAFQARTAEDLAAIDAYLARCGGTLPAAVLVDGHAPGLVGGTGQLAPWELLASYRPGVPLILAGGLTPENVTEAIRVVRPYAVDVASGVESAPGRKDPGRVREFIARVRAA